MVFGLLATSPARAEVRMNFLRLSFINGHLLKKKRELDFVVRQERILMLRKYYKELSTLRKAAPTGILKF